MEKLGLILTRALFRVKVGQKNDSIMMPCSGGVISFLEHARCLQRSR